MTKRILCVLLATAMLLSAMAGCGKKDTKSTTGSTSAATESKKSKVNDTLVYAQGAEPRGLDPALIDDGESSKVITNIYEGLVQYKKDSTELEPCLATSWDVSKDGLSYTFHLRKDVKFQDGTDFNADAVKFNYDRQLEGHATEDMSYASFVFGPVKNVVAVDASTVTINLKAANTPFLANLAMTQAAPIVSPKALKDNNNNVNQAPCGTGPYKFVRWDKDQDVILVRNDNYWGTKAIIKNVIFKFIKDNSARVVALNNGEADIIDGVDPTVVKQITSSGNKIQTDKAMMTNYMAYNTTSKLFKDAKARRAISAAINLPEMVKTLYQGYDEAATSILPTVMPGYDKSIQQVAYDPAASQAAVKELGITSIHMITYSNPRPYNTVNGQVLAEAIQGYLAKVGVKCVIDAYDWTTFKSKAKAGDYDICFAGWGGDNGDPDNFLNLLASEDVTMNYAHYKNAKYNELIAKGLGTPVGAERSAIYTQCEKIAAEDAAWLPISHANFICGVRPNITGFYYHIAYATKFAGVTKG